jgi:predicted transcriptional regulator
VVGLAAQGLTSNEIARTLSLSRATVETHFRGAARRLSARNRAHAIALALTRGEIALPSATVAPARRPKQSHNRATRPTRRGL